MNSIGQEAVGIPLHRNLNGTTSGVDRYAKQIPNKLALTALELNMYWVPTAQPFQARGGKEDLEFLTRVRSGGSDPVAVSSVHSAIYQHGRKTRRGGRNG